MVPRGFSKLIISEFMQGKPYHMDGPMGRQVLTDQYVVVTQGKQEKEWPFSACSDSKFTDVCVWFLG